MDLITLFCSLDSKELQEVVCDVAHACAYHVHHKCFESDGYDQPLFLKTFEYNYEATLNAYEMLVYDEEIPF